MKFNHTYSNCENKEICNNAIQVKCPKYENGPINNTYHEYRYSTLIKHHKPKFSSNTNSNLWQDSSTTNYACKPYNCPQSILLIKDTPVTYKKLDNQNKFIQNELFNCSNSNRDNIMCGANRYVHKYHHKDSVNGYITKYDMLKNRDKKNWNSQLFDEKCNLTN